MNNNISREAYEITELCMKNKDLSKLNDLQIAELYISTLYQAESNVRSCSRDKIIN